MRKELDLYRSHRLRSHQETGNVWLRAFYLPAVVILMAGLCIRGAIMLQSSAVQREIAAVEQWMAEEEDRYREAELKWAYHEALMARTAAVEELNAALSTYPQVTGGLVASIAAVGGETVTMSLTGYDSATGALQFVARSGEVIDIPGYISDLRQTGLFSAVDYSGYRYTRGAYYLELSCTLRERGTP